jgi:hypothetical protein
MAFLIMTKAGHLPSALGLPVYWQSWTTTIMLINDFFEHDHLQAVSTQ